MRQTLGPSCLCGYQAVQLVTHGSPFGDDAVDGFEHLNQVAGHVNTWAADKLLCPLVLADHRMGEDYGPAVLHGYPCLAPGAAVFARLHDDGSQAVAEIVALRNGKWCFCGGVLGQNWESSSPREAISSCRSRFSGG